MFQINPGWFRIDPWSIIIIAIILIAFLIFSIIYGIRAHRQQVSAGREELIGKTADATTILEPKGTVFIQGESWAAILDEGRVESGEEVIITKVEGLKLRVAKKK
ncbi:NfeD family protein [Chloroflexota bacterium]